MDQVPALVEPFLWRAASHSNVGNTDGAAEWLWCHDGAAEWRRCHDGAGRQLSSVAIHVAPGAIQEDTIHHTAVACRAYVEMDEAREPVATFQDEDSDQDVKPADLC